MPTRSWMGREEAVRRDRDVAPRILREDGELSYSGGSRSCATDSGLADARERVPPAGCRHDADARERVPPAGATYGNESPSDTLPCRRHPSRSSLMAFRDNRSTVLFVTVVAEKRTPMLASEEVHGILVSSWRAADSWIVGRYIVMPDHLHFFCAPTACPPTDFHKWMAY